MSAVMATTHRRIMKPVPVIDLNDADATVSMPLPQPLTQRFVKPL
jgi:hypothetical protein